MKHSEITALIEGALPALKSYVDKALLASAEKLHAENESLRSRITELEARDYDKDFAAAIGPALDDRIARLPAAITLDEVRQLVIEEIAARSPTKSGENVDPEAVRAMISESVDEAATALSAVLDEKIAALPERPNSADIRLFIDEAVAALPPAKDGKSIEVSEVRAMVVAEVATAVSALPAPIDGKDADMDAVFARIAEEVRKAAAAIPVPKNGEDGAGIAELLIDRDGALVATFTDGRIRNLGPVVGKDGKAGETFDLDDFDIVPLDDGRTFKFCFTRGTAMHSFELTFPLVLDRGVYDSERTYDQGDAVTWGGSLWIAQRSTGAKPDTPDCGWRLAVKRGRDGRDAR